MCCAYGINKYSLLFNFFGKNKNSYNCFMDYTTFSFCLFIKLEYNQEKITMEYLV